MMSWSSPWNQGNEVPKPRGYEPLSQISDYIAITADLSSSDCIVYGLNKVDELYICKRFIKSSIVANNGIRLEASPFPVMNALSELGYQVICCGGMPETLWTLKRKRYP